MKRIRSVSYHTLTHLPPEQYDLNFADGICKHIFCNKNVTISIKDSLKFGPKGPINNIPALVQIMAWCRPGDKPLSESMLRLRTHICVTRPQWVQFIVVFMHLLRFFESVSYLPLNGNPCGRHISNNVTNVLRNKLNDICVWQQRYISLKSIFAKTYRKTHLSLSQYVEFLLSQHHIGVLWFAGDLPPNRVKIWKWII